MIKEDLKLSKWGVKRRSNLLKKSKVKIQKSKL